MYGSLAQSSPPAVKTWVWSEPGAVITWIFNGSPAYALIVGVVGVPLKLFVRRPAFL